MAVNDIGDGLPPISSWAPPLPHDYSKAVPNDFTQVQVPVQYLLDFPTTVPQGSLNAEVHSLLPLPTLSSLLPVSEQPVPIEVDDLLLPEEISVLPKWMKEHIQGILKAFMSADKMSLVSMWAKLEIQCINTVYSNKRLSRGCPTDMSMWSWMLDINSVPSVSDIGIFQQQASHWWASLQPLSRQISGVDWPLSQTVVSGEDWSQLCKTGKNGIYLIVMMMWIWKLALTVDPSLCKEFYTDMTKDIAWAFTAMADTLPSVTHKVTNETDVPEDLDGS
ncbi:uncharacterized protein FOMMEDRAFT_159708 [Fomitiporia mediterranea MF3/22]|uniref:uncharacterized protein n=1 Tax=Fomitiporia mediterranea (strain MF3/22) TaxID=694068 RepID=UPI00044086A8|nr:uncharacterized protein FOMMEDRAFT_159708 [Fomitiporia mediterranea MF3/22]EJD00096.1 hypothetical protein FOMMEDRAFT_159708 [Fomitiporia mediterranea MF3/22]